MYFKNAFRDVDKAGIHNKDIKSKSERQILSHMWNPDLKYMCVSVGGDHETRSLRILRSKEKGSKEKGGRERMM